MKKINEEKAKEKLMKHIFADLSYEEIEDFDKLKKDNERLLKILKSNKALHNVISSDYESIEEKGELYITDILKMPLFIEENINVLQNWFRENSDI